MEKYLDLKNDKDYTKIKEASKIINNGVELVVVTDHNTIVGCEKLEVAIDIYKSNLQEDKK